MSGMITHRRDPVTAPCQPVEWSRRALALGGGRPPVALCARANLLHKTTFTTWTGVRACEKACTLNNRVRKPKPEISKTTDSVSHSVVWLFVTPMDCSPQGSSVSEILQARIYWSGLPFPSLGYLSNPGIKPRSPTLQADTLPSEPPGKPFCHQGSVICISEIIDISPSNLGSSLCFIQPDISHDVLCV